MSIPFLIGKHTNCYEQDHAPATPASPSMGNVQCYSDILGSAGATWVQGASEVLVTPSALMDPLYMLESWDSCRHVPLTEATCIFEQAMKWFWVALTKARFGLGWQASLRCNKRENEREHSYKPWALLPAYKGPQRLQSTHTRPCGYSWVWRKLSRYDLGPERRLERTKGRSSWRQVTFSGKVHLHKLQTLQSNCFF